MCGDVNKKRHSVLLLLSKVEFLRLGFLVICIFGALNLKAYNAPQQEMPAESQNGDSAVISRELEEIVVTAAKIKSYPNRDEIFPGEANKQFGANALDAVASLPIFITKFASSDLLNLQGNEVAIIINGHPATYEQLKLYQGEDLKKVVYYPFTPAKYAGIVHGPIAEITIKKPREALYRIQATIFNSAHIWDTSEFSFNSNKEKTVFTYMDSLHLVMASYDYGLLDKNRQPYEIESRNGSQISHYSTNNGWAKQQRHSLSLSYQYDANHNVLSASAFYRNTPYSKGAQSMLALIYEGNEEHKGQRTNTYSYQGSEFGGSVFYDHYFTNKSTLSITAQTSVVNSNSHNGLNLSIPGYSDFENHNATRARVLNASFLSQYDAFIGQGYLNLSLEYKFSKIVQFENGTTNCKGFSHSPSLRCGYDICFSRFSLNSYLGYNLDYLISQNGMNNLCHIPFGNISLGYKFNDCISLRTASSMGSSYISLAERYDDNKYYDEESFYQESNFMLKPTLEGWVSLSPSYLSQDGNVSAGLSFDLSYKINPFFQFIIADGDNYIQKTMNVDKCTSLGGSIYGKYKPFSFLETYAYLSWSGYQNPLTPGKPNSFEKHSVFYARGIINAFVRNWTLFFELRNGKTLYEGDKIKKQPFLMQGGVAWKSKQIYASMNWYYNFYSQYTELKSGNFSWCQNIQVAGRNYFELTFQYTFTHGMVKKYKTARQSTISTESGLLR